MGYFITDVKRWATLGTLVLVVWLVTAIGGVGDPLVRRLLEGVLTVLF